MYGRIHLAASPEDIAEHFEQIRLPSNQFGYNITPARKILCIVELEAKSLKAVNLFWRLAPS